MRLLSHALALPLLALALLATPCLAAKPEATDTRPAVGSVPPDVFGEDHEGNPVRLADHRGKVVIVTFWASWCGPCLRELPVLDHIRKTVGGDYLEVVAVNFKETRGEFRGILRANPGTALTWVHDRRGTASDTYGVEALPNMFIIGRDGRISSRHIGYGEESIRKIVDEMLALLPPEALSRPANNVPSTP